MNFIKYLFLVGRFTRYSEVCQCAGYDAWFDSPCWCCPYQPQNAQYSGTEYDDRCHCENTARSACTFRLCADVACCCCRHHPLGTDSIQFGSNPEYKITAKTISFCKMKQLTCFCRMVWSFCVKCDIMSISTAWMADAVFSTFHMTPLNYTHFGG